MLFSKKKPTRTARKLQGRAVSTSSYYRPKNVAAKPTKIVKNSSGSKRKISLHKTLNALIAISVVVLLFSATTMSASPDIQFRRNGYAYRDISEYESAAADIMNSSLFNQSKVFFRSFRFEAEMKDRFPEISFIDAVVPIGGRDLTVSLTVSEPLAFVSNGLSTGVINNSGVLVIDNVSASGLLNIRFASPQTNFNSGSRLFTRDEISMLQLIMTEIPDVKQLSGIELVIDELLFNVSDGQIEIGFANAAYHVKLSTFTNAQEQVGALKATIEHLDEQGETPSKYVDVRVPGRTFVL
ncbi:MAG: hypothetical protein ACI9T8_000194 [Candidatus Saccharimonadales bacterium]|jgi:hypothetical protein